MKKIDSYLALLFACAVLGVVMALLTESLSSHPPQDVVQMLEKQKEVQHAR